MKTVWKRRSEEWIKANPKQGTMYKVQIDERGNEIEVVKNKPTETIIKEPEKELSWAEKKRIEKHKNNPPNLRGVYMILCEPEKHVYVGQSFNMPVRLRNHKMIITSTDNEVHNKYKGYLKIREHYKAHGKDGFQFVDYEYMRGATDTQLLKREADLMLEMVQKGYTLYNSAVSKQIIDSSIYCPASMKGYVSWIVRYFSDNPNDMNKLTAFVKSISNYNPDKP